MINKKTIAIVVPAYNEERLIGKVLRTMPNFVDKIIIIDDKSTDRTTKVAKKASQQYKKPTILIRHPQNRGVGGAIISGYLRAREMRMDVVVVMAGDAQMDPAELRDLINPIIKGEADYVKGNRLIYGRSWKMIPKYRYLGNSVLSLMTKIASGYWHVADSQTGYLAISGKMLDNLPYDHLYQNYGFENDMLIHLNVLRARVKEIPVKPVYNIGEKSGMVLWKIIPGLTWLLVSRFFWRLKTKYIIEDFHPLVFFYFSSIFLSLITLYLFIRMIIKWAETANLPVMNTLLFVFCTIMAAQFLFFAMWFDMDYNKELKVK